MTDIWLDYSGLRPDLKYVKSLGVTGVLRYLSAPQPATAWKRITAAEVDAILNAGLDLILNFEWYEGRMLEGRSAGEVDGSTALRQAKDLGYPKGATIYFSHDTSARNDHAVKEYLRGAQASLGDYYYADIYSGVEVVEMAKKAGLARYGWQTIAWSNGAIGTAHIYQNGKMWFNKGADEDRIHNTPLGSWVETLKGGSVSKPPKAKPKPSHIPAPSGYDTAKYTVRSGDTLTTIAVAAHTTVNEILRINVTIKDRDVIYVGEEITIPHATKITPSPHPKPAIKRYRVAKGDNLIRIAKRNNTTVRHLMAMNPLIKNANVIHVGEVLRVR